MKVKLEDVIDALESANQELSFYYEKPSGKIIMRGSFGSFSLIDDDDDEDLEYDWDEYVPLPGQYEINEYAMMEDFVASLPEGKAQDALDRALLGKGAFRKFKDKVNQLRLADSWYKFRDKKYEAVALEWCQDNDIEVEK